MTPSPFKAIVEQGGGVWVGIMESESPEVPDLLLFNSRQTGSTLALPLNARITAGDVRRKITESNSKFGGVK